MPADIEEFVDGSAAFVSARLDAWHQLGTVLPENLTAEDVMTFGHLGGWNVRKQPLFTTTPGSDVVLPVPDQFAVVRNNPVTDGQQDVLGVVGNYYTPIQNEAHVDFLQALVDESGAVFETAGSLDGGRQVFVTMKLPQAMTVGGVDRVDMNLVAVNSHDGKSPFRTIISPVRVVCANTLAAAFSTKLPQEHKVRHTTNANLAVQRARESLGLAWKYMEEFEVEAEKLLNTPLTTQKMESVLTKLFGKVEMDGKEPAKGQAQKIHKLETIRGLLDAPTQANVKGTRWAAYNALTEYADHFAPVYGQGDEKLTNRAAKAVQRGMEFKEQAFALLSADSR